MGQHLEVYVDSNKVLGMTQAQADSFDAVDTDTEDTATDWIDVSSCEFLAFYVDGDTGDHVFHKVGIQMSPDGIVNGGYHMQGGSMTLITGKGHGHLHDIESMSFIRLCVQTAEGSTSTSNFYLQAFRKD